MSELSPEATAVYERLLPRVERHADHEAWRPLPGSPGSGFGGIECKCGSVVMDDDDLVRAGLAELPFSEGMGVVAALVRLVE